MATWFAQNSSVNIDSVNQWNSAANGSGSWLTWASLAAGDELVANAKTAIAINVNVTCASIRNTTTLGGTAGGGFTLSGSQVVTAALYSTTNVTMITISGSGSPSIIGDLIGGGNTSVNYTVNYTGSGTLSITGNLYGASASLGDSLNISGTGTVNLTGNVTGTGSANLTGAKLASGQLNVTGNVTGGSSTNCPAILANAGGVNITGNVTGGSGGSGYSAGVHFVSTGTLTVTGDVTGGSAQAGVLLLPASSSTATGKLIHSGNAVSGANGHAGVASACVLIHASNTLTHTYRTNSGGSPGSARSLYTGGVNLNQPEIANVRSGTVYGASSEYTGTLAVPSASLVAIGVSVDNTTGTFLPNPQVLQQTTIATLASQTSFTLTAGSADNDVYNGQTLIIQDASTSTQKAVGTVLDYVGATKTITLTADPAIFTMAVGDSVSIVAGAGSSGGGSTDWDATERSQIRHRLGIDGTTAAPSASPSLASPTNITAGTITTVTTLTGHTPQTGDSFARIGALGAGLTSLSTQTSVDDLPTNAELATALGTADDAVLAAIATVQSDTNDIQTRLPAALESGRIAAVLDSTATAALVDLIWDEPLTGATHNVATSSGKRLRQTTAFQQIDSTVIDASATTTTFVTGLTSSVDNFYNDSMLVFTDGALAGQVRAIYDYIGATKTIVLEEALTSAPVNGVAFAVVSLHIHPVSQIQNGLATSAELVTLRGVDNDTLKTLSDQIDTVSADVSSIASVSREAF
jgi:hypothetical protein